MLQEAAHVYSTSRYSLFSVCMPTSSTTLQQQSYLASTHPSVNEEQLLLSFFALLLGAAYSQAGMTINFNGRQYTPLHSLHKWFPTQTVQASLPHPWAQAAPGHISQSVLCYREGLMHKNGASKNASQSTIAASAAAECSCKDEKRCQSFAREMLTLMLAPGKAIPDISEK